MSGTEPVGCPHPAPTSRFTHEIDDGNPRWCILRVSATRSDGTRQQTERTEAADIVGRWPELTDSKFREMERYLERRMREDGVWHLSATPWQRWPRGLLLRRLGTCSFVAAVGIAALVFFSR